jgi:ABC-type transporter Mla MlaB component
MNISYTGNKDDRCMVFEGAMTHRFSRDIENQIIDSMRKNQRLKVDLSGVNELDLCGIHLLGVLFSYGAEAIQVVAASPIVEAAISRLHLSRKSSGRKLPARGRSHPTSLRLKP